MQVGQKAKVTNRPDLKGLEVTIERVNEAGEVTHISIPGPSGTTKIISAIGLVVEIIENAGTIWGTIKKLWGILKGWFKKQ